MSKSVDGPSRTATGAELAARIGEEIGVSSWTLIDQARVDAFADVTEDWQFIHVDPERAALTPFGGTIAHGFLTLSLMPKMGYEVAYALVGMVASVNYGFDKVRFLQPVRTGQRIRGRFVLAEVVEKEPLRWLIRYTVTVEIDGEARPALIADWLGMQMTAG